MDTSLEIPLIAHKDIHTEFKADWPEDLDPELQSSCLKACKIFFEVISWIIFPIKLIQWGGICLRNYIYRTTILLASNFSADKKNENKERGEELLRDFKGEKVTLKTPDGAKIEGAFFPGAKSDKVIIYTAGNACCWENALSILLELKQLDVSILFINPRGVMFSEGEMSPDGFSLDVYTGYEYVINSLGIDPNNVLLIGRSLGGSYGAMGSKLVQKKYQDKKIKMISVCSFSSLGKESASIVKNLGHYIVGKGCLGKVLTKVGSCLAPIAIKILNMQMDEEEAFLSLKGNKGVVYCPTDQIIPEEASLFEAIKENLPSDVTVIKMDPDFDPEESHNREFNIREGTEFFTLIGKLLNIEVPTYQEIQYLYFEYIKSKKFHFIM